MLNHLKRSMTPMHATPTVGTKSPVHPQAGHHVMSGNPSMPLDHPAGGGGMPLPAGGPGNGGMPHIATAPHVAAPPRMPAMRPGGRKMPPL